MHSLYKHNYANTRIMAVNAITADVCDSIDIVVYVAQLCPLQQATLQDDWGSEHLRAGSRAHYPI